MQYRSLLAIAGVATAQGLSKGFNYGNVFTDGTPKQQADFEAEFTRAQDLPNASGFSSARLYTMIQGGTTNFPISAIQAAIDTKTSLLLGLWASASSEIFQNELDALSSAIEQYGSALTDLVVGISVGSEDLYRSSVQGIENESGLGESPDILVDYIQRTRSVIAGTAASTAAIGHVDTWNDWANVSNSAVIDAVDWIGFNGKHSLCRRGPLVFTND
jgi:glucan endo-1,3-beta-D-glucosidase